VNLRQSRRKEAAYAVDPGLACLIMVCEYYARRGHSDIYDAVTKGNLTAGSLPEVSVVAERIGFRTRLESLRIDDLRRHVPLPCIVQLQGKGFVVLYPGFRMKGGRRIRYRKPGCGFASRDVGEFLTAWESNPAKQRTGYGLVLLLEPAFRFYADDKTTGISWRTVVQYFRGWKWYLVCIILSFILTSLIQLMVPFLMQGIVDVGIGYRSISFVVAALLAQLMLLFSRLGVDFIRSYLLFQLSRIVNLSILSDFWIKLSHLPISNFDVYRPGDIMQRLDDNRNIRNIITGQFFNTFFSAVDFFIFSIVLVFYNLEIFLVFLAAVTCYIFWIRAFLPVRRKLNTATFHASAKENDATLQFVQGMHEIKLQNIQQQKRWGWEDRHVRIFRLNLKSLLYARLEDSGTLILNQGKDIVVTFIVVKLVIDGRLTIGAMFAIQYILGQLSNPIELFLRFVQSAQDAKISMGRLNEIHKIESEESVSKGYIRRLPADRTILIRDLGFAFPAEKSRRVLNNIDLQIPEGKVTAIVGTSGSGKTTLLKLLLKYYQDYDGQICIGDTDLKALSPSFWRGCCGAVLQDGFIFNDTITGNISLGKEPVDHLRIIEACRLANILSFIQSLPDGLNTLLGVGGTGISQGQRQRILIARVIYKDPEYLFFDEFTNALDANSERIIVENLQHVFRKKTVVIVAHRLSTVKNADNIIVMHEGRILEQGDHNELIRFNGGYLELIKNQLDIRR
jgi:ATP-binding cassette subfamily B protein